jgi:glycosyltransferase involved in cell wall biosynthesis
MCYGGSVLAKRLGVPIVYEIQSDILNFEMPFHEKRTSWSQLKIASYTNQKMLDRADKLIAVSTEVKQQLVEKWQQNPSKIAIVPCGVFPNLFLPGGSTFRNNSGINSDIVIGFIGAFYPWHGVDVLVEAFAQILNKKYKAKLLLIGSGPELERIKAIIGKYQIEGDVIFTGIVPHDTVPDYLNAMDIAVAPYIKMEHELWFSPLKIFEYMAAGKAIVAANGGQISEIIRHGENGILVEPGNANQVAEAIELLIRDPETRKSLGNQARSDAIRFHTWESRADELSNVLKGEISRKKN